jgi:hypothetical protein
MTVYLIDLEGVDTRYTGQWKEHFPPLLMKAGFNVRVIEGPTDIPPATTPGAFLNFGGTNVYKANQVEQIARLFCDGSVKAGDYFLFSDAWHPGIINLKYMAELLKIKIKIGALWHAGSYDPQDFLGRLIGDAPWVRHAEKSFYHAIDHNYFATEFHVKLFFDELLHGGFKEENPWYDEDWNERYLNQKIVRTGWPMEYLSSTLKPFIREKQDLILFPHRIAPEKQVDIFRDLAVTMPEYKWVVCQELGLTKQNYHDLLGQCKMVFSANLQETLGISCYEALCVNAMPMIPDRLSYTEMYSSAFKYPEHWTSSWDNYVSNKASLVQWIKNMMGAFDGAGMYGEIRSEQRIIEKEFFSADKLIETIRNS